MALLVLKIQTVLLTYIFVMARVNNKKLKLPVMIQPGTAENLIEIELGYGRKVIGEVGAEHGFNANIFQSVNSKYSRWVSDAEVKADNSFGVYELVSTQQHHSLTEERVKDLHLKRKIIQEGTLEEYKENPNFIQDEKEEIYSITNQLEYNGNKWAMAIDLNKCTNCAVCVASCNVENNVPVVGKEQVSKGREMQWIRIDRYYSGTNEAPIVSGQPMLCQQCDNAPCENVCPVNATWKREDGIVEIDYDQCIGCRYCITACPYSARTFDTGRYYTEGAPETGSAYVGEEARKYEDEPTYGYGIARYREEGESPIGNARKCTFCIHRLEQGLLPECVVSCIGRATYFGDANDPESLVSELIGSPNVMRLKEEMGTHPKVYYLL